jgi:hypothetical protein
MTAGQQAGCGSILGLIFLMACFGSLVGFACETTTYAESISPSGSSEARVQMTDCGATTGFSRVVWVQPAWLPRDRSISCRAVALDGQWPVSLDWTADSLVVSTSAPPESVIAVASPCQGLSVRLRHLAPDAARTS